MSESEAEEFFVVYKINGFEGERRAGPFSREDVEYQRSDTAGYEGVLYASVVSGSPAQELKPV